LKKENIEVFVHGEHIAGLNCAPRYAQVKLKVQ